MSYKSLCIRKKMAASTDLKLAVNLISPSVDLIGLEYEIYFCIESPEYHIDNDEEDENEIGINIVRLVINANTPFDCNNPAFLPFITDIFFHIECCYNVQKLVFKPMCTDSVVSEIINVASKLPNLRVLEITDHDFSFSSLRKLAEFGVSHKLEKLILGKGRYYDLILDLYRITLAKTHFPGLNIRRDYSEEEVKAAQDKIDDAQARIDWLWACGSNPSAMCEKLGYFYL